MNQSLPPKQPTGSLREGNDDDGGGRGGGGGGDGGGRREVRRRGLVELGEGGTEARVMIAVIIANVKTSGCRPAVVMAVLLF